MKKLYILIAIVVVLLLSAMFFVTGIFSNHPNPPANPGPVACTEEAKLCPDGTSVGRVGPKCEFAACPNVKQEETASIGQRILNKDVYMTPIKLISDSRCPANVLCISAGNVSLRVKLERLGETKTVDFNLTNYVNFSGRKIMLTGVTPARNSVKPIVDSDYRFTFSVTEIGIMPL